MSRIGLMPITVPQGVKVAIADSKVTVEGKKGKIARQFSKDMIITLKDNVLTVARPSDEREHKSLHGLSRTLLANMVEGVTNGFEKNLELSGVGYRAQKAGNKVALQIGFVNTIEFIPPAGVDVAVEGTNKLKVVGIDKELVGLTAAKIRALRPCDAYKGKGIKYSYEKLRLKAGKAGKATAKK